MKQRSLKNTFVQPRFQLKLCLFYVVTGVLVLGLVSLLILGKLQEVQGLINNNPRIDFLTQSQINNLMMSCVQYALFGFMFYIVIAFTFALIMGHRIAGPLLAINAYITALKEGDYDYDRQLRPNDELKDTMSELKALKAALIARDATKV